MTKHLRHASPEFALLKELFGPSPVLSSEDAKAYDAIWARILESIKAGDFIEQMLSKDLADATWEMKRISRHKALVIERKIRDQQEIEEAEEAELAKQAEQAEEAEEAEAEQLEDCVQGSGQADQADKPASEGEQVDKPTSEGERGEKADQVGAPTTQFERMLELAAVVDSVVPDCDAIIAGPVDELEYADAFEAGINYYVRLDGLYTDAMHRREDLLKQLELYRQGLGRHLRQVSDDIIEGEFSETKEEAPSITGPDGAPQ